MKLDDLLNKNSLPEKIELSQEELIELLYKYKGLQKELERDRSFWESTNKNLEDAYQKLDDKEQELQKSLELLKKTQEELVQERFRTLIETMPYGVVENDKTGTILYCNTAFKKILGYTEEEILGKKLWEILVDETNKNRFQENIINSDHSQPTKTSFSIKLRNKNDSIIDLHIEWNFKKDHEGFINGFISVITDITEQLKMEEEKKALEMKLQFNHRMESLGTLAGGIAHDFNNLLTGILGNISLLSMELSPDSPHHERLKKIASIAESGAELTKQILLFARGESTKLITTDINKLLHNVIDALSRTKKDIVVRKNFSDQLWTVDVDRGQFEQVILNLYINALQAMPDGGMIIIHTENVILDDATVKPYSISPGKYIKVSLSDSGVGMDKETMGHIFEPFFTTKEKEKGTGLGLAIVYGIIKNHRGMINVYSEKGKGSTFSIYLPVSKEKSIGEIVETTEIVKGSETILLVDDEDIIIDVGEKLLLNLGYTVITAHDGREAIKVYAEHRDIISIVILDMIMPGLSAGEVIDELIKINSNVCILLSSGYSLDNNVQKVMEHGCKGFIQKPFSISDLSNKIRMIL